MSKIKGIAITIFSFGLLLFICPPFLLPDFLYQSIYGWRYPKEWKCGESLTVDQGPAESIRYIVRLGTVNLGQKSTNSWELCQLPQKELICGLFFPLSEKSKMKHEKNLTEKTVISMRLYRETGELIFEENGNLGSDWFWSGYYDGNTAFVYNDTAITPKTKSKYRLEFEVLSVRSTQDIKAEVVLRGGGWK